MRPARIAVACGVLLALACSDSGSGPTTIAEPPEPPTNLPDVRATLGFGDGPLEGFLSLDPSNDAAGWTYRVDLDEDGVADQEGTLVRPISFGYRFVEPGLHHLLVVLEEPTGRREEARLPIVVNDPSRVRVVRETTVSHADPNDPGVFEGIAVDPDGRFVYLGEFRGDAIHRLDASSLEVVGVLGELGHRGIEGLSITPSGRLLVANFKRFGLLVVSLPDMGVQAGFFEQSLGGEFYIDVIDERSALLGQGALALVDFVAGETIRLYTPPDAEFFRARHFALSPDGSVLAAASSGEGRIDIVRVPELEHERTLVVPGVEGTRLVSFDPTGRKLYMLRFDRFMALEIETGRVLTDLALDASCSNLCVANPVARSLDGRYVAFETRPGVLFIDTVTDLPVVRSSVGASIAASPVENVFFALNAGGRVQVLEVVR